MTSILKTDEIQSQNGSSAIDVANGTLKHPSASGNNLVLSASGLVSLSNGINGVRTNQNVNSSSVTLTGSYQDIATTTITPKSSNSKLLVLAVFSVFTSSVGAHTRARIKLTATGHTVSYSDQQEYIGFQSSNDPYLMAFVPINYIFTVSNTNTYTITLEAYVEHGNATANYYDSGGQQRSTLQVIEI